ncbi:MAG: fumarate hydratase [Elusimicrobiota bacterium]|jgi:fumarate hydratase subunit alpha|nr:fumarate hydratase [Elusimicrobiota bacterium]
MRLISAKTISEAVMRLCGEANYELPADVLGALRAAYQNETAPLAKEIILQILQNAQIAKDSKIALCQDTGTANVFVKAGREVFVEGGTIYEAVNKGVADGYERNFLRKSIAADPLLRQNTKNNTPANIYLDIVEGDKIEITLMPKGGGSENASALKMLTPAAGWEGVKKFVIDTIKDKGANACPPIVLGIGIGGDFSSAPLLSKKALLREIGSKNPIADYDKKEKEMLGEINNLGIGPMGLGGKTTALAVFIETKASHIASLPCAVSFQCHSCRRKTALV